MSGFFAGISGGLYAHFLKSAGPSTLELTLSFQVILWVIFGGIRTIYGPVAGVYILYLFMESARFIPELEEIRFMLFALILILTLLFMPQGLTVWFRDKTEVGCQRCKEQNSRLRDRCKACGAPLYFEAGNSDNIVKTQNNITY